MAGWSSLSKIRPASLILRGASGIFSKNATSAFKNELAQQVRHSGDGHHKTMYITPSRFQWHKFKDMFHYYVMIGAIPIIGVILYCNIFIGPAQLAEVPEGYVPKHWEYHRHPITRFFARYIYPSPQQEYEKTMHVIYEEDEKKHLRALEKKIRNKMAERLDYQAYYYRPVTAKYHRIMSEENINKEERKGQN